MPAAASQKATWIAYGIGQIAPRRQRESGRHAIKGRSSGSFGMVY